jgi:predicted RNase H-like HicB family nuclease
MNPYVFPALFEFEDGVEGYTVSFPDLPGCHTEGDNLEEALAMAKEALGLHLYNLEEDGYEIPKPSDPARLLPTDEGFYTLIEVRTGTVRNRQLNKSVTKNVTLPRWLELEATKAKINYSQLLQQALKQELNILDKH